jgi:hypothetical protein
MMYACTSVLYEFDMYTIRIRHSFISGFCLIEILTMHRCPHISPQRQPPIHTIHGDTLQLGHAPRELLLLLCENRSEPD